MALYILNGGILLSIKSALILLTLKKVDLLFILYYLGHIFLTLLHTYFDKHLYYHSTMSRKFRNISYERLLQSPMWSAHCEGARCRWRGRRWCGNRRRRRFGSSAQQRVLSGRRAHHPDYSGPRRRACDRWERLFLLALLEGRWRRTGCWNVWRKWWREWRFGLLGLLSKRRRTQDRAK